MAHVHVPSTSRTTNEDREDVDVLIISSTYPNPEVKNIAGSQLHIEVNSTGLTEDVHPNKNLEGCTTTLVNEVTLNGTALEESSETTAMHTSCESDYVGKNPQVLETSIFGDTDIKIVPQILYEVPSLVDLSNTTTVPAVCTTASANVISTQNTNDMAHVVLSSRDKFTQTTPTNSILGPDASSMCKLALDVINSTSFAFSGDGSDPTIYPTEDLHGFCLCCYEFPCKPYVPLAWPPKHAVNFELVLAFRKSFLALMHAEFTSSTTTLDNSLRNTTKVIPTPTHIGHGRCFCCYADSQVHLVGITWPPSHYALENDKVVSGEAMTDSHKTTTNNEGRTIFYNDSNRSSCSLSSSKSMPDGVYGTDSAGTSPNERSANSTMGPLVDLNKSFTVGHNEPTVEFTDTELLNDATLSRVFAVSPEATSSHNPPTSSTICIPANVDMANLDCSLDNRGMAKFSALNPGNPKTTLGDTLITPNRTLGVSGRHSKKDWAKASQTSVKPNTEVTAAVGLTGVQRTIKPVLLCANLVNKSKTGQGVTVNSVRATTIDSDTSIPSVHLSTQPRKRGRFEIFGNVRFHGNGSLRDLYCDLCGIFCSTGSSFKRHLAGSHVPTSLRSSFKIKTPTERVHPFMCPVSKCKYTNQSTAERRSHLLSHHNCYLTGRRYNEFTGLIENQECSGEEFQVGDY